jgi:hypothetical protein
MKKTLLLVLAALVVPSVALAAKPAHKVKPPAPQVKYELKGTLSNYTAYDKVTPANGTITILVKSAGPGGKALKGQTLTFVVDANTVVTLKKGLTTVTNGDNGMITVMAAKHATPAVLQASPAKSVNDHGIPMSTYTINGTLSAYTAYASPTNGTVTILVKNAKPHGKSLKGATLVFSIDANTKVMLKKGLTTITNGDKGQIKVRAPKKIAAANLAATLQSYPAKSVHDQGAPKPKH